MNVALNPSATAQMNRRPSEAAAFRYLQPRLHEDVLVIADANPISRADDCDGVENARVSSLVI